MKKLVLFALLAAGCGGGYTPTVTPVTPVPQNAVVSGQYMLRLTSTNGHGSTTINTNCTQAERRLRVCQILSSASPVISRNALAVMLRLLPLSRPER
jgi:hypothetical protein